MLLVVPTLCFRRSTAYVHERTSVLHVRGRGSGRYHVSSASYMRGSKPLADIPIPSGTLFELNLQTSSTAQQFKQRKSLYEVYQVCIPYHRTRQGGMRTRIASTYPTGTKCDIHVQHQGWPYSMRGVRECYRVSSYQAVLGSSSFDLFLKFDPLVCTIGQQAPLHIYVVTPSFYQ